MSDSVASDVAGCLFHDAVCSLTSSTLTVCDTTLARRAREQTTLHTAV